MGPISPCLFLMRPQTWNYEVPRQSVQIQVNALQNLPKHDEYFNECELYPAINTVLHLLELLVVKLVPLGGKRITDFALVRPKPEALERRERKL